MNLPEPQWNEYDLQPEDFYWSDDNDEGGVISDDEDNNDDEVYGEQVTDEQEREQSTTHPDKLNADAELEEQQKKRWELLVDLYADSSSDEDEDEDDGMGTDQSELEGGNNPERKRGKSKMRKMGSAKPRKLKSSKGGAMDKFEQKWSGKTIGMESYHLDEFEDDQGEPGDDDVMDNSFAPSTSSSSSSSSSSLEKKNKKSKKEKVPFISNDDLLYDPSRDDKDEVWAEKKRRKGRKSKGEIKTDGILHCPACFTVLSYECQRHERYHNQFRSTELTEDCRVDVQQVYYFQTDEDQDSPAQEAKKANRKGRIHRGATHTLTVNGQVAMDALDETDDGVFEEFNPVMCSICETQVGVRDQNAVCHLFNIFCSEN